MTTWACRLSPAPSSSACSCSSPSPPGTPRRGHCRYAHYDEAPRNLLLARHPFYVRIGHRGGRPRGRALAGRIPAVRGDVRCADRGGSHRTPAIQVERHLRIRFAYIMTRPLGASIGDYLSQPRSEGGLGLGTVGTSALFLQRSLGSSVPYGHPERRHRDRADRDLNSHHCVEARNLVVVIPNRSRHPCRRR